MSLCRFFGALLSSRGRPYVNLHMRPTIRDSALRYVPNVPDYPFEIL